MPFRRLLIGELRTYRIGKGGTALTCIAFRIFNFMVVMVTPPAFDSIGYNTYTVFACINAFMVPCVFFFYPEVRLPTPYTLTIHTSANHRLPTQTAGRSLEEMDEIFHDVSGFKGAFTVVKVAHDKPRRYGKNGELLINYDDTEEARRVSMRRNSSIAGQGMGQPGPPKFDGEGVDHEEEKSRSSD